MTRIRLPISGGQKAIVLKAVQDPLDISHNLMVIFELNQLADRQQLEERMLNAIAERPALLMKIIQDNGSFFQESGSIADVRIQTIKVASNNLESIIRDAQALADKPFDIIENSLLRIRIYDREEQCPVVAIIANHAVADLASFQLVFYDIVAGGESALPKDDLNSIKKFLAHDILARRGETGLESAEFWRAKLQGAPEETGLPLDRARPATRRRRGVEVRHIISSEKAAQIRVIARAMGVTEFTIHLAAFFLLLSVHDDSGVIVVGTPMSLRGKPFLKNVVGYLANVLPIKVDLPQSATLADVVKEVRARTAEAMDHVDHPLDAIIRGAGVRTHANVSPLFQTLFMWNDLRVSTLGQSTADPRILHLSQRGCAFDLMPTVFMTDDANWFSLQGDANIFDRSTLEGLAGDYFGIIDLLCKDTGLPVGQLRSCLGPPALLTGRSEGTDRDAVAEIFMNLSSGSEVIAIKEESREITYAQLGRHAKTAQEHLCRLSLGANDVVALSFDRSFDYVAYMLACLASGITFVPVSAHEPYERLLNMLRCADAECLITTRELRSDVAIPQYAAVTFEEQSISSLDVIDCTPSSAAYILFTSGSTGTPKGVSVSRGALSNTVARLSDLVGFGQKDSLAAISAFTFDISLLEILMPLSRAGCLHLLDNETSGDAVQIANYVASHSVSFLQATPSMWRLLVMARFDPQHRLVALCGGEALSQSLAQDILPKVDVLWNLYGPTETTIWASAHQVTVADDEMPIGSPIPGMTVGVFDRNGALLQEGVVGELGLAGDGLAIGYASDPFATAERFRTLAEPSGARRWYFTGDLGMVRDGVLLFRGRRDGQVKVHGHRIELREIATIAERLDGVAEAAAVTWQDNQKTRISLFFSHSPEAVSHPVEATVLCALRESLPRHMHPHSIRAIDHLPKTPNGKTDHREMARLAAHVRIDRCADNAYRPPDTATEAALVEVWESVLRIDRVGVDDDFFELGGTSIEGVEIAVRAQNLDIQVSPETLLTFPTIAGIAAELDKVKSPDA